MLKTLSIAAACVLGCAALTIDAAAAKPAKKNTIKGKTSQGRVIRLARNRHGVQLKRFKIKLRCRDGSILIDDESGFLTTPLRHGKLRDHQVGSTDDVWLRAQLKGRVVRGKIRVRDRVGKVRCDSHWVRFHAR